MRPSSLSRRKRWTPARRARPSSADRTAVAIALLQPERLQHQPRRVGLAELARVAARIAERRYAGRQSQLGRHGRRPTLHPASPGGSAPRTPLRRSCRVESRSAGEIAARSASSSTGSSDAAGTRGLLRDRRRRGADGRRSRPAEGGRRRDDLDAGARARPAATDALADEAQRLAERAREGAERAQLVDVIDQRRRGAVIELAVPCGRVFDERQRGSTTACSGTLPLASGSGIDGDQLGDPVLRPCRSGPPSFARVARSSSETSGSFARES